jgi:hypothetical protein
MNHTPGPWYTNEDDHDAPYQPIRIGPKGDYRVASVFQDDRALDYNREQEANARLITAAPDLLLAAREALECCNSSRVYKLLIDAIKKAGG